MIITTQSLEATNICGNIRFCPILDSFSLLGIYLHTIVRHNMTQEGQRSKLEFTLGEFDIQLMLSEYL